MLYEVAIIEHPTEKEQAGGALSRLVFGPVAVMAESACMAGIAATAGVTLDCDLQRAEALIRPFDKL